MFRDSSTTLSFMAQLGRALFGHTVSWHADKRVLDDLRGAQTAVVSVCAFFLVTGVLVEIVLLVDVTTDLLSDPCCPRCSGLIVV